MRGRAQASVVALIGSWFPLISPATVALVTLRRGSLDGMIILLWALLPALAALWISDMGPLMPVVTLVGLIVTLVVALMLRGDSGWPKSLMGLIGVSALSGLAMAQTIPDPVQGVTQALGEMFEQMQAQAPEGSALVAPTETFVVGLIAYVIAVSSFLSLLLARWWQAMLYNPGGLQSEFHQLRLTPIAGVTCFLAAFYCWNQGIDYQHWGGLFGFPLVVAAAALAHGVVKARQMSGQWLILFYVVLVFASPVVMVLALVDTWTDFRSRIGARTSPPTDRDDDEPDQ